jgi:hypothetical protein
MIRQMKRPPCLALCCLLLAVAPARAADDDGKFAVKGVGTTDCRRYTEARTKGGDEYLLYAGYIGGYVTAYNQLKGDNFDILPWHTVDTLTHMLASFCDRNPATRFSGALAMLTNLLKAERVKNASPLVTAGEGARAVTLYQESLRAAQARLAALGLLDGEPGGRLDPATRSALERFQVANGLPVTGLPDQRTLFLLHYPRKKEGG